MLGVGKVSFEYNQKIIMLLQLLSSAYLLFTSFLLLSLMHFEMLLALDLLVLLQCMPILHLLLLKSHIASFHLFYFISKKSFAFTILCCASSWEFLCARHVSIFHAGHVRSSAARACRRLLKTFWLRTGFKVAYIENLWKQIVQHHDFSI